MKKLAIILILSGFTMVGWYGYQYWSGMQSVTKLDGDVVKEVENKLVEKNTITAEELVQSTNNRNTQANLQDSDEIAQLVIPSINTAYDVFWGTSDEALAKGVGMYDSKWTTTPDLGGHTVLSGHRDSVFQPIGELQEGESVYVRYQDVDYEYRINKIWITDENDHSVIVEKDEPTLTLSTCYPFQFIGSAPDRYIVQAELVNYGGLLDLN